MGNNWSGGASTSVYQLGAGVEFAVTDAVTVRGEVVGQGDFNGASDPFFESAKATVGVFYHFYDLQLGRALPPCLRLANPMRRTGNGSPFWHSRGRATQLCGTGSPDWQRSRGKAPALPVPARFHSILIVPIIFSFP